MQAEEIRGTLRNAGFTEAQVEGLTAVLVDLANKNDIRDLRVELHREISGMWRKLALTLFAQTMTIVLSVAAIQIALG